MTSSVSRVLSKQLNFVNGVRQVPRTPSHRFTVYEPATGGVLCEVDASGKEDVNETVNVASQAFPKWSKMTGLQRGKVLTKTADLIRSNLNDLAYWETRDNGKPIYESRIDIEGCADVFDFFGGAAATIHGDHIPLGVGRLAYTRREPLGVVAGIGAWNFPLQTASWKLAPALACGNAVIYKPSPFTPLTAVLLAELLTDAGLPHGAINILQGEAETGRALCAHADVAKVSFTGSVPTGQSIMRDCATGGLKPVTLELGGKSPLVIFDDCHLDNAVTGAMMANFFTQGEVCSNASRVFVQRGVRDEFLRRLLARTAAMPIGDPMLETTRIGASISREHVDKVAAYIQSGKDEGATVVFGGERVAPAGFEHGYYLSPCVMTDVRDTMRVAREEIFGAVLLVMDFDDEDEAVRRANDTHFGLAAGLFTNNVQRAYRVTERLSAGTVYVNTFNDIDAAVPFGGFRMSGFGRELGLAALNHYTQIKAVFVNTSADAIDAPF